MTISSAYNRGFKRHLDFIPQLANSFILGRPLEHSVHSVSPSCNSLCPFLAESFKLQVTGNNTTDSEIGLLNKTNKLWFRDYSSLYLSVKLLICEDTTQKVKNV